jgi:antitoxin component YwqK of YwqJK toxin-antitoxin module
MEEIKITTYQGRNKTINIKLEQQYYSNGKLWYELFHENDIPQGRGRDYYTDGNKAGDWNNSNGLQEGEQVDYVY